MLLTASLPAGTAAQGSTPPFQDNYADVNGMRLHYASVGQGPLVLFLHGYPSFWYQWKDQMAEMGRDHLAVGLDMRGYNLSSRPEGLEPYTMKHLVEDVRQFAEKVGGKDKKFVLVAHDWGANVAWVFAMYHPEMLEKLIIVNGAHPFLSERELRENPAQRYASNYFFVFNKLSGARRAADRRERHQRDRHAPRPHRIRGRRGQEPAATPKRIARPGSTRGRSRARRPPASTTTAPIIAIRRSTIVIRRRRFPLPGRPRKSPPGAKSTIIRTPTLVIWGMKDNAILSGHLSGLDKWVPNLRVKLYPDDDHWVMLEKNTPVAQDIRRFVDDKDFPKESVYR